MDKTKYKNLAEEIDQRFSEIAQEFNDSRSMLKNDGRVVRTRLLLAFSFLEVICNIYNIYFNLRLTNKSLLLKWIKEYCLDTKNRTYKAHLYLSRIDELHLYKFRNAIVHAFSLPEAENGVSITVPNGLETAPIIERLDVKFKKAGHIIAFISPDSLLQLFLDGFMIMYPEIFKNVSTATQSDLEGLERVANEFNRRGAHGISLTS